MLEIQPQVQVVLTDAILLDGDWQGVLQIVAQAGANIEVIVSSRLGDPKLWIDVLEQGGYDVLAEPYGHHEEIRRVVEKLYAPLASAGAMSYKTKGSARCVGTA
jgi:DNA-binding NtrC family response regulator